MKYLLHCDGALPNLALMRLGSYFRARGEGVALVRGAGKREMWGEPGEAFGSSIFRFSEPLRESIRREWGEVRWGGTGVRVESSLSEIDAAVDWGGIAPDYSLYPDFRASLGFTQRGCRLKCSFCVVPKKEGAARSTATVADIWRGAPHKPWLLLLDNDFFGQAESDWRARVDEMRVGGFKVCFSQGINIRQVDEASAAALASLEYRDNQFQTRVLYTAWDSLGDEKRFKRGVDLLARAGVPPKHLRVYMLVGFAPGETFAEVKYRFDEMVALGCEPYPMVYDRSRRDLMAFARWAIRGLYRAVPWEAYRSTDLRGNKAAARLVRLPMFDPVTPPSTPSEPSQ